MLLSVAAIIATTLSLSIALTGNASEEKGKCKSMSNVICIFELVMYEKH